MARPATTDYLDVAVDRIAALLRTLGATLTPPVKRVVQTADEKITPPFWWIYPGVPDEATASSDYRRQTYAVNVRLVVGSVTTGYDRVLAERLWVILPTVITYLIQRRHLVAEAGQTPPRGLDSENVRVEQVTPFGAFNGTHDIGIELQITLPFTVTVDLVYP